MSYLGAFVQHHLARESSESQAQMFQFQWDRLQNWEADLWELEKSVGMEDLASRKAAWAK